MEYYFNTTFMFNYFKEFISESVNKIKQCFIQKNQSIDKEYLQKTLLDMNFMPHLVKNIINIIENDSRDWKEVIKEYLINIFPKEKNNFCEDNEVFILIGINGSGKTTTAIKLSRMVLMKGKTLLVPADTFRAAAKDQLCELAKQYHIDFFDHNYDQPAMVAFKSAEYANNNGYKNIVIDTAGRIHQNENLMRELKKTIVTARKQFANKKVVVYLVLDGVQGKNLLEQTKIFTEDILVDGIILTKIDAGIKPGIIFSIVDYLKIGVVYLGIGQKETDLVKFNVSNFVSSFFE